MPANELYAFDAEFIEVAFNARPNAEAPQIVRHRLRKPTVAELLEREQQIKYDLVEISSREDEIQSDDEIANARLWDKIAVAVKDYRGASDWRDLTAEDKAAMRPGHKTAAIRTMYASECAIEGEGDEGVSIGGDMWWVRQSIGVNKDAPTFIIRHRLREPTEAERTKFKRSASSTSYVKGAKKAQVRVKTNLRAFIELYDALIQTVYGGTVDGREWGDLFTPTGERTRELFTAMDPIFKRQVLQCLMSELEAQLSD